MTVRKIESGRVPTMVATNFVGAKGTIFYEEDIGELRLSDGYTPGGKIINSSSGGGGLGIVTEIDGGDPLSEYNLFSIVDGGTPYITGTGF